MKFKQIKHRKIDDVTKPLVDKHGRHRMRSNELYLLYEKKLPRIAALDGQTIVGYKKAVISRSSDTQVTCIIKLEIGPRVLRMQPRDEKCRAASAKVLSINLLEKIGPGFGSNIISVKIRGSRKRAISGFDQDFVYEVGKVVHSMGRHGKKKHFSRAYDECQAGIHFFLTRKEAAEYDL